MSRDYDEMFQNRSPARWAHRVGEAKAPPPEGEELAGSTDYKPYGFIPADGWDSCDIAWWLKGQIPQGQAIQYRFLVRVGYLGDDTLQLMMSDCVIVIQGRNLRDLRKRLARGRVTFIQAYNANVWPMRPPAGEPIIDDIAIHYPGELPASRA